MSESKYGQCIVTEDLMPPQPEEAVKAMEDQAMLGAYNAVAPEFVTNKAFTRTLARVVRKPFWFPKVPAIALKILFGKMGGLVLEGSRVSADKIEAAGFTFRFRLHETALKDLLD